MKTLVSQPALNSLKELGKEALAEAEYQRSIDCFSLALKLLGDNSSDAEYDRERLLVLVQLVKALSGLGKPREALAKLSEAISLSERLGDQNGKAELLVEMGDINVREGLWQKALQNYKDSLRTFYLIGSLRGIATALKNSGIVFTEIGKLDKAIRYYRAALRNAEQINDLELIAKIYNNLGAVFTSRGNWKEAIRCYKNSVQRWKDIGHLKGMGYCYNNIGMIYADEKEWDQSLTFYNRAFEVAEQIKDTYLAAIVNLNATEAYLGLREIDKAKDQCLKALGVLEMLGDKLGIAEAHKFLGVIDRHSENWDLAENHLHLSIQINQQYDCPLGLAEAYRELALVHKDRKQNEKALQFLGQSLFIFRKLKAQHDIHGVSDEISNIEKIYLKIIQEMGAAVEAVDFYTFGHSKRVANYVLELAQAVGLDLEEIKGILTAAFLHDLGKTAVDINILHKPGKLTDEEFEKMKTHSAIGIDRLSFIEFPWEVKSIILHHHEHYDGKGYPRGLKGEAIPLGARIVAIADFFDALTTDRSYRPAWSGEKALALMRDSAGSVLDSYLTEIFIQLIEEKISNQALYGDFTSEFGQLWPSFSPAEELTAKTLKLSDFFSDLETELAVETAFSN